MLPCQPFCPLQEHDEIYKHILILQDENVILDRKWPSTAANSLFEGYWSQQSIVRGKQVDKTSLPHMLQVVSQNQ